MKFYIPPYIFGLWSGDKYWWGSSIGLTNTNIRLIKIFREFFKQLGFNKKRIKLSVYTKSGSGVNKQKLSQLLQIPRNNIKTYKFKKGRKDYFIIYVNSRQLKREFENRIERLEKVVSNTNSLFQYIAGRFDSDGYYSPKRKEIRISYTTQKEVERDGNLVSKMSRIRPRIKFEKQANTWNLELTGKKWIKFIQQVLRFSKRAAPLQSHRQLVL